MKTRMLPLLLTGLLVLVLPAGLPSASAVEPAFAPQWESEKTLKDPTLPTVAAQAEADGSYKKAAKRYHKLYEQSRADQNRAYALLREADCYFLAGKYTQAQKSYKLLLENYASIIPLEPVLVTQRELAAKLESGKASVLRIKNPELAVEVYETFLKVAMMGQHAPQDMLRLAALKEKVEDVDGAITTYRDLTKRFPSAPESAQARLEIARLLLKRSGRGYGDGRYLREAKFELQRVQKDVAGQGRVAEAQAMQSTVSEAQASRLLALGQFYQRRYSYRPETARRYLHDVVRFYPNTQAGFTAGIMLAKMEPGYLPGQTGVAAGSIGPNGEFIPGTPEKVEPPPEKPVRYLPAQTEPVKKWLLPLEDLSDDLRLQK